MKFCIEHWNGLRKAIDDHGMSHLISKNGEIAGERMEIEMKGNESVESFDPLLRAHFAIINNALNMGGLNDDYCPICESEKHGGHPAQWWFDNAVNEQFNKAKELGLIHIQ